MGVFADLDPEPRVFGVSGRKRHDSPERRHQNATGRTLGKARKAGRGKELGLIGGGWRSGWALEGKTTFEKAPAHREHW